MYSVRDGKKSAMSAPDKKDKETVEGDGSERLARFLAHAGIASRRHAEELIAAGRVQINGTMSLPREHVSIRHRIV